MSRVEHISSDLRELFDDYYEKIKEMQAELIKNIENVKEGNAQNLREFFGMLIRQEYDYIYHYNQQYDYIYDDILQSEYTEEQRTAIIEELQREDSYFKDLYVRSHIPSFPSKRLNSLQAGMKSMLEDMPATFQWPEEVKTRIKELLDDPFIAEICKNKNIDVEYLFEKDFDSLCEKVVDIWKVGINPDDIVAECIAKQIKGLDIYFKSKISMVYRCILAVKKEINATTLDQVFESKKLMEKFGAVSISAPEITQAINQFLEKKEELIGEDFSAPEYREKTLMEKLEFDIITKFAYEPIFVLAVTQEIEKRGLQDAGLKFYDNAVKLDELVCLCNNVKKIKELYQRLTESSEYSLQSKTYYGDRNKRR